MSTRRHRDHVSWEQSINERYLNKTQKRSDHVAGLGSKTVSTPRNTEWTGAAPRMPHAAGPSVSLVGRVALSPADADLGRGFYVGDRYVDLEGAVTVVSWAADVALLFFEGRDARPRSTEGPAPGAVAARRSFKSKGDRLVDFEDDVEPGTDAESAFTGAARLSVPAPPSAAPPTPAATHAPLAWREDTAPRGQQAPATVEPPLPKGHTGHMNGSSVDRETPRVRYFDTDESLRSTDTGGPDSSPDASTVDRERVDIAERSQRAARLLEESLEAPRTGRLASVLATLQPEQYRLVTWPLDRNLVVQGHPGTGKTIVAAHRAAFLVLPGDADGAARLDRVALVGPTDRWKSYIEPSVRQLTEHGVEVLSVESLVRDWAHRPTELHPRNERWFHSVWEIGRIVDRAARALDGRLRKLKRPADRARMLIEALVSETATHRRVIPSGEDELKEWLLDAGSYQAVRRGSAYLLFSAAVGIVTGGIGRHSGYQHLVVDEAQDIRPVEWWMLTKLFRAGTEPRWSLFGDMNQRRSDFTWGSWEELTDRLELAAVDAAAGGPLVLDTGYRSTREILRFADRLLPRAMRGNDALRRGPDPTVRLVGRTQLTAAVVDEATRLAHRHPDGSVAVITCDPGRVDQVEKALRQGGWRRAHQGETAPWHKHKHAQMSVSRPVQARGLEYDGVVVVEPADFGRSVGRHGELYTSLTRANQELAIVHSKAMPRELQGRGNRVK